MSLLSMKRKVNGMMGTVYDFRSGKPENIRGYETKVSAAFDGSARDLIAYRKC